MHYHRIGIDVVHTIATVDYLASCWVANPRCQANAYFLLTCQQFFFWKIPSGKTSVLKKVASSSRQLNPRRQHLGRPKIGNQTLRDRSYHFWENMKEVTKPYTKMITYCDKTRRPRLMEHDFVRMTSFH